jgi:hypothetical protein
MQLTGPHAFNHASFQGRIGLARADITPPVGIYARNWGAAKSDVAPSVHRPLTLTAMALAPLEGGSWQVLIDTDLGWWRTLRTFHTFQAHLLDALSLEPANLLFALSHTHSAPPLFDADDSLPGAGLHRQWMKSLVDSAVSSVRQAMSTHFTGVLDWHMGRCALATVRDLPDPQAQTPRFLCGYNPDGDADDTLLVGRVTDSSGQIRATLTNYACHPTTLAWDNTAISPDYVGAMRATVEQTTGAPALFLIGACGELAPRYQYVGDPSIADRYGQQLGFATLATLHDMEPPGTRLAFAGIVESGAPLAVWKHEPREVSRALHATLGTVELPLKNWPTAEELERQRLACADRTLEERIARKRNIRQALGDGSKFRLPVYVWRIGDAVLAGMCCEPYSAVQRELRRRFPECTIVYMNLVNGSIGYLPPAELYDADVYQVWQTPFDRGSFERTVEAMSELIRKVLAD